jgi:methyltransferase-like protein 6
MVEYHCHDFEHTELLEEGDAFIRKAESWITNGLAGKPPVGLSSRQRRNVTGPFNNIDDDDASTFDNTKHLDLQHKIWELFHSNINISGMFFKPRRFILAAFPDLKHIDSGVILEVGTGNGSNVVPLLEQTPSRVTIWVTDVSRRALEIVGEQLEREHFHTIDGQGWRDRVSLFQYDAVRGVVGELDSDITTTDASEPEIVVGDRIILEPEGKSAVAPLLSVINTPPCQSLTGQTRATLAMFVLSAIPPSYHATTFKTLASTLQLGGLLCFRDYGLYDLAMLRADAVNIITNTTHRRGDGTLVTYFTPEQITLFMEDAGLTVEVSEYHTVMNTNRKKNVSMRRCFVHAVGRKTR